MSVQFRESDGEMLVNIIEHANHRYMRQSRVNQKSTFNILRVLSAFKETSELYGTRSEHIYNLIIYITKQYNPQTMAQWINAVHELSAMNRKYGIQCVDRVVMSHPLILNRTVN